MAITQDYILKGGLRSSDEAANNRLQAIHKMEQQKQQQGADLEKQSQGSDQALRNLIQGKQFDEESGQRQVVANAAHVREEMRKSGIDPTKASMNFNESGGGYNPDVDPMGKAVKKAMMGANITGYNVADPDRVIPTVKDAEEVKKATGSLKALQATGTDIQGRFEKAGPLDRFGAVTIPFTNKKIGTEKGISLDSGVTDMVIQLKELANLGAITGPDMALMESAMGNVTGIGSLVGDKKRAIQQLNDVMQRARSKVETNATSRGYAPQQGYLDQGRVPPAAGGGLDPTSAARLKELRAKKAAGQLR